MKLNDKGFLQRLYCLFSSLEDTLLTATSHRSSIDKKWFWIFAVGYLHLRLNLTCYLSRSICYFKYVAYFRMGDCAVG